MTTSTAIVLAVSILLGIGAASETYHRLKKQKETMDRLNEFLDEQENKKP